MRTLSLSKTHISGQTKINTNYTDVAKRKNWCLWCAVVFDALSVKIRPRSRVSHPWLLPPNNLNTHNNSLIQSIKKTFSSYVDKKKVTRIVNDEKNQFGYVSLACTSTLTEVETKKLLLWIFIASSGIHLLSLFVRVSHQQHGVALFDTNVVLKIILQRFTVREEKRKDKIPQDEFEFDARCSMLHSDECFRRALKKNINIKLLMRPRNSCIPCGT